MPAQFLNADLDIFNDCTLQPLIDEIGDRAMLLYEGPGTAEFPFLARYEIDYDLDAKSPESLVAAFCDLVSSLSPQGRALWDASKERIIDLGYRMSQPWDRIQDQISPATLRRMAELQITLAWTFYPPDE
jgi:hypothetical protein